MVNFGISFPGTITTCIRASSMFQAPVSSQSNLLLSQALNTQHIHRYIGAALQPRLIDASYTVNTCRENTYKHLSKCKDPLSFKYLEEERAPVVAAGSRFLLL